MVYLTGTFFVLFQPSLISPILGSLLLVARARSTGVSPRLALLKQRSAKRGETLVERARVTSSRDPRIGEAIPCALDFRLLTVNCVRGVSQSQAKLGNTFPYPGVPAARHARALD